MSEVHELWKVIYHKDAVISALKSRIDAAPRARPDLAHKFLEREFRQRRSIPSDELFRLAMQLGITRGSIYQAKLSLPIKAKHIIYDDGSHCWEWAALNGWPA